MTSLLSSIWTPEQVVLTAVIVACCVLLVAANGRTSLHESSSRSGVPRTPADPRRGTESGRRRVLTGRAVLGLVLVAVAAFLAWRSGDPIGVRNDSWSDANVLVTGWNYAREGLRAHAGAPQHQLITDQNPPDPYFLYTGYPAGANLVNGIWQVAHIKAEWVYRLLPAACSLASVVLWFSLLRRFAGESVAVVAAIALALSYGFLAYADNLHFHAYAALTSVAAAHSYVQALEAGRQRRWPWFLLTAVFMFVTACFTWEYHLWMLLFFALFALLFKCPVRRPLLALLALPLLAALALQTLQRHLALASQTLGSESPGAGFLADVYRRTLGFATAVDTPPGLTLSGYPTFLGLRYYEFYGVPAIAAVGLLVMLLMRGRRAPWQVGSWATEERLLVILLAAGAGWWVVMLQHTAVHPHVMRQGLAGYALLMGIAWVHCWRTARAAALPRVGRAAAIVLALVLGYPQLEGLVCDIRIHVQDYGLDDRERGGATAISLQQLSALRWAVPPGAVILTNHHAPPLLRVWSGRPVYRGNNIRYPFNASNARVVLELSFNHLRDLYADHLPPLYYVYTLNSCSPESVFAEDSLLGFLLIGSPAGGTEAWSAAEPILAEALQHGRSDKSVCPIVACVGDLLVFDLQPMVPRFRTAWTDLGFPTRHQFGPPG